MSLKLPDRWELGAISIRDGQEVVLILMKPLNAFESLLPHNPGAEVRNIPRWVTAATVTHEAHLVVPMDRVLDLLRPLILEALK